MHCYLSEILEMYHEYTNKTYTEMALDFDVALSNLYHYRNERGNPTADTIDKIIKGIEENCPEILGNTPKW